MKKQVSISLIGLIAIESLNGCDRPSQKNENAYNISEKRISRCTLETGEDHVDHSSYKISINSDGRGFKEIDCRLTSQFAPAPSKPVRVIVKNIALQSFDRFRECDAASVMPPDKSGKWSPLSGQLRGMPFESQLAISAFALDIPECRSRMFPSIEERKDSTVKSTIQSSLKLVSRTGGADLPDVDGPATVLPIAVLAKGGKLDTILCASFVYDVTSRDSYLIKKEKYFACIENFTKINSHGES